MSSQWLLLLIFGFAGLSVLLLIGLLVVWRMRSVQPAAPPPPPAPAVQTTWSTPGGDNSSGGLEALFTQLQDLASSETMAALQQVQASNLQVNMASGQPQFVVDGVTYSNVDDIPDPALREQTRTVIEKMSKLFGPNNPQALLGSLMDAGSLSGDNPGVQWVSRTHQQFIFDGKIYTSLDDIPDLEVREKVRAALDKLL